MKIRKFNDEVLYAGDIVPRLDKAGLDFLKQEALKNPRQRIRLCMHRGVDEGIHEMFIVHPRDAYVRPHKHLGKPESFFVIEGEADIILFNEEGQVVEKIRMGSPDSGKMFYYRMDDPVFHALVIHSETLCFKEVTAGPFRREDMVFAPWSPEEADAAAVVRWMNDLR